MASSDSVTSSLLSASVEVSSVASVLSSGAAVVSLEVVSSAAVVSFSGAAVVSFSVSSASVSISSASSFTATTGT